MDGGTDCSHLGCQWFAEKYAIDKELQPIDDFILCVRQNKLIRDPNCKLVSLLTILKVKCIVHVSDLF
jgi:hypothetical protein